MVVGRKKVLAVPELRRLRRLTTPAPEDARVPRDVHVPGGGRVRG